MKGVGKMYERIEVWKRAEGGSAVRFQCLRRASDGMFAVQNADFLRPDSGKADLLASDAIFVELFMDEDPTSRCDWFSSVSAAIASHEKDFSDMPAKR
jgi:hypothetical protein